MNQLCKVCGEPAAGFHFGAFTCEGCKSFFGRTYNNISAISGCKNNGDCVINKKNRTACKACRLRKCLLVGMSKSGSRYGRRSNWFKIHCLLQEQQQQHSSHHHSHNNQQSPGSNTSPINTSSSFDQFNFTHHHINAKQTYQDKTNPSIKTANLQNKSSSASLLLNPFLPVQQLINNNNNKHNNNKHKNKSIINQCPESKTSENNNNNNNNHNGDCSTPSDSGASSADPEDEKFWKKNDFTVENYNHHDSNRSSSEPLKFFPFTSNNNNNNNNNNNDGQNHYQIQNRNPFVTAFQHMQIPTLLPILNNNKNNTILDIQDEPIDLSIKSIPQKRCRTTSPSIKIKLELTTMTQQTITSTKPTPLDLTLVRSQPMSG